jgi:hypothetical protein
MKKLLCLCAAMILTFTTVSALAATDVTGAWNGELKSADGSIVVPLIVTLKQDGTTLTGSITSPQSGGDPIAITDGKIDGDKVSFKVLYSGIVISHNGTIISHDATGAGDEIKLTSTTDSPDFPGGTLTLTRAKPAAPAPAPAPAS